LDKFSSANFWQIFICIFWDKFPSESSRYEFKQ
jgi:hypothetical protein